MNKMIKYLLEGYKVYEEKKYIDGFISKYPEIYNNHPPKYYAGKCSVITCLFILHCIEEYNVKDVYLVRVYDYDFDGNMDNYRGCHVVAKINDYVYDMSYKQMSEGQSGEMYKIESFNTWKKQWVRIDEYKYNAKDARDYIVNWSKRVKKIRDSNIRLHYDDLHKFGYI